MQVLVGRRLGGALFLAWGMFLLAGYPGALGQTKDKPAPTEEEKAPAKQKKDAGKEEQERSTAPAGRQVPRVGDEDAEAAAPRTGFDLRKEAANTKNRYVKELFQSLSPPHDLLTQKDGTTVRLNAVPRFFPPDSKEFFGLMVTPQGGPGKRSTPFRLDSTNAMRVQGFEQVVLDKVNDFLKAEPENELPGSKDFMSRLDMLQEAEKALVAGILYHRAAKETGKREGTGWIGVEKALEKRLVEVQAQQVHILTNTKNWKTAFALENRLEAVYAGQGNIAKPIQEEIAHLLASHAMSAIESQPPDYETAIKRLRILQERFPDSPEIKSLRGELGKYAETQLKEADRLTKEGKKQEAMARLRTISDIDPTLPGLQDMVGKLNDQYPVLRVGVSALPTYLSPARARTEVERQAVELLFEGLVGLSQSAPGGERYEPELSAELPRIAPLARRFALPRNARWSDGQPVHATDVAHTHRLLTTGPLRMRDVAWAEMMGASADVLGDNFHITLKMKLGYFDPLSLMDFKILPEGLPQLDDERFARAPVGSGPFCFPAKGPDGKQLVLTANPYYSARAGKKDKPIIREVRFVMSHDPIGDFRNQKLDFMFDLSAASAKELGAGSANVQIRRLPTRRITFLAVNHRPDRQSALHNEFLRRGLAHALKRDQILNECFRAGMIPPHHELFGPYPQGSWAARPDPHPYRIDTAQAQLEKAKKAAANTLLKDTHLKLKYPDDDPAVEQACALIKKQIEALEPGLIVIDLIKRTPGELREDVEMSHDYDLAYYSYDFPNQTYWLWPLFEPSKESTDPGGSNFLGYQDAQLVSELRTQQYHCDFADVQAQALKIYERCWEKMPFIPLWQLDTYLAASPKLLLPPRLDAMSLFRDVDSWVLKKE